LKLRSKFTLLLVACAVLLATPAIVMALMTDLGSNILPTIQSDKADIAGPSANPHGNTSPAPAIQGEEADHAPGKTITVTGSHWQPGESVHINVNDNQGNTWGLDVDVTADASGQIQDQIQLPDWFAATYKVTAMGTQSGVATTSFIDGKVSFRSTYPAPASWTVNYTTHGGGSTTNNTSCATGGTDGSKTISPDTTGTASVGISNKESMRLGTVTLPADSTLVFDHWTDQNGNTVANDSCLSGDPSGTNGNITDLIAHFDSAKQAPEAQPQPIVSTDEDTARTITLSGTDEDGDDLSFFMVSGPNHGTLGPIRELTCTGTAPRTCSANVTYTPDNGYNGFDIFSFKANDSTIDSNPAPVSMLVDPVNDTPVATDETKTMSEDGDPLSIDFGALLSDVETSDANLTYDIADPDPAKGSLGGEGSTRNFTPATDFNGTVNIDYTLADRGDPDNCKAANPPCAAAEISARNTLTVTVDAVNDAPSFTKGPDQTKHEDAGEQTVEGWATAISAGPNESGQTVDFQLTNDNNGLFAAGGQPEVDASGKLTYEAAPNANGSATVTVKLHDDGGTRNGGANTNAEQRFTITINAINDEPVAHADTMATDEDTKVVVPSRDLVGNDDEGAANESSQTLTVTEVYEGTEGTVSLGRNGDITFTPATDFDGQASFVYTVCDNGSPSECSEMIAIVNVTMSQVNDAPSFVAGADQTVAEDSGPHSVSGWATGISAGPVDESDQQLTFEVSSNANPDLFSTQPSVAANGTLSYTPAANANGSAAITVKLHDDGGTAIGGVDTSSEQTFIINVAAVNDAPIVSNLQGDGAASEGDVKTYTFDIADVDSSIFTASVDCGGAGKGDLIAGSPQITATNGEFECKFLDGLASPTPVDISVQLSDGDELSNVASKSVSVSNVPPTLTGVSSSSQNALAGTVNPVTFTGTATDVSPSDLAAAFSWRWAIDGGAYGPFGAVDANNQLYFSTCGTHTVEAQASDKDGGVSAESPQATKSVSVYDGAFDPPLVDGSTNMVEKGQVVPVEISIGCGTNNLTNLTPHIQLLSGNVSPETESGSTTVRSTSVLSADSTQAMRPVDGGYIYNLQVPSNAAANQEFTVRVNPFGDTDHAATSMYVVIKILE
jgi:hypothetical protein